MMDIACYYIKVTLVKELIALIHATTFHKKIQLLIAVLKADAF